MNRKAIYRPRLILVAAMFLWFVLPAKPQHARPAISKPPDSCGIRLASAANWTGSPAYLRLRYLIAALDAAQESVTQGSKSLVDFKSTTDPTNALAALLTGADQAEDALHCAAAVITAYPATEKGDKTLKVILTSAFNREADSVAHVTALIKLQVLRPCAPTNANVMHDAERMSAITKAQNGAASDILLVTTSALLDSVDLSDKHAKTTKYLSITCEEYANILTSNAPSTSAEKSAYTVPATLIQDFFNGHKCRAAL